MRRLLLAAMLLVSTPTAGFAEWQIRPFLGVTFGGNSNLRSDVERTLTDSIGKPNVSFGVSAGLLGQVFGVEADLDYGPGFFQTGGRNDLVQSSVTTVTGNVTIGLPRRMVEYTLRPYFVGGAGVMRPVTKALVSSAFDVSCCVAAVDFGGGITGFLTRRVGVSWELRHFQTVGGESMSDLTTDGGPQRLSFWRLNMALAFRY